MNTCPVCGTAAIPGARFCFQCGTQLDMAASQTEAEAERRVVTVLFGDLTDFTAWAEDLDPERVSVVIDRVLAACAVAVADHGGHVDKLTGDGIMAVFGAPTAHEDDAERAVRAAHAMQVVARRLVADESGGGRRLGLRVGLNTGEVLAGIQAHHSYTVVGDTVNTASRLSDVAPVGGIIAGRETALATMHSAAWRAMEPLRLKGKREPVAAYELVRVRAASGTRLGLGDEAAFVGRDGELGMLVGRARDAAGSGDPSAILVQGEAGVGKTRLVRELSLTLVADGWRVLVGRCAPYGEGKDYSPIRQVVRTAAGIDLDTDDRATAVARVQRLVARLEHPTARVRLPSGTTAHLLQLLGLGPEQAGPWTPTDSPARLPVGPGPSRHGHVELDAVAALLRALAAEGPLLLVIDDLHWSSPVLQEALSWLGRQLAGPVLVVGVGRTGVLEGTRWWRRLPGVEKLDVEPLEEAAGERLLRAYLDGAELAPGVREALLVRSGGNPFFLAELLHLLVDRGHLRPDASTDGTPTWTLDADLPPGLLPMGVQAVLTARIDELDGQAKAVLRDAAVLGPQVRTAALVALAGDVETVRQGLTVLLARRMLVPEGDPVDDGDDPLRAATYVFSHALIRDVAYASVSKGDRARRHAAAAAWARDAISRRPLADAQVATQAGRAVELAEEMSLPGDDPTWLARPLATGALTRLGLTALARDDMVQAEHHLGRALLVGGDDVRIRVARAEALASLRRLDEAEALVAGAVDDDDPEVRASAWVVLGDVRRKQAREDEARQSWVRALQPASEAGADRLIGQALREIGLLEYFAGRMTLAEERFEQALQLARSVGDRRDEGWALQHLAWSATSRGDYAAAAGTLTAAAEVFASLDDTGGLAWCAGTEAFVHVLQGRLAEARTFIAGLLPVAQSLGERWGEAICLTLDAIGAAETGHVEEAEREAAEACEVFAQLDDIWGLSLAHTAWGVALRARGALPDAVEHLSRAVELSVGGRHPLAGSLALVVLGLTHLEAGDVDAAAAVAERATTALEGMDLMPHAAVGPMVLAAQVRRARGELALAAEELGRAAELAQVVTLIFPRRQVLAHQAGTLLELGRSVQALVVAREAVETPAEDVRSQVLAWRVLGSVLLARDEPDAAVTAFTTALQLSAATGATAERQQTEHLLGRAVAAASNHSAAV